MDAIKAFRLGGWCWYCAEDAKEYIDEQKNGKWMHFFSDQEFAMKMCEKALDEGVCRACKCTDMEALRAETGVICFYLNGDDMDAHRKVIRFMIDNGLIPKTKTGRLYNISFKFDRQTRGKEYGTDFKGEIKLAQFVNLATGEWIF